MTTSTSNKSTTYEVGTIVHVNPQTLLMQRNVREAKPDADLIRSIKAVGVLEPITAVLTTDSALLVRYGHRRTLAAIEATQDTVPVYVSAQDATDTAGEIARIVAQRDENTHRSGLGAADEIGIVETLTGLGLTAAQVAKQARIKRGVVDNALTVAGSAIARKATERYETLTLDQAAVVAEFEDDTETAKALIVAAVEGKFDHVAQRARDDRATAQAEAELLAQLEDDGVSVIQRPGYEDTKTLPLRRLRCPGENGEPERVEADDHRQCPGHVAWLSTEWVRVDQHGNPLPQPAEPDDDADEAEWDTYHEQCDQIRATSRQVSRPCPEYGCTGWRTHGHIDSYAHSTTSKPKAADMSDEQREQAKAQRRLVIENNKAWAAAEPVRREFLTSLAKAKTAPKGTARFLAVALCTDPSMCGSIDGNTLAAEWLKIKKTGYGRADLAPTKSATENRALLVALIQILAGYEAEQTKDSWRGNGTTNNTGRYLRFLATCGYTLSDVEQYAISKNTA